MTKSIEQIEKELANEPRVNVAGVSIRANLLAQILNVAEAQFEGKEYMPFSSADFQYLASLTKDLRMRLDIVTNE